MPSFLAGPDLSDLLFTLPTIKHLGGGMLYVSAGGHGERERMSHERLEFIKPLIKAQSYIEGVKFHEGERLDFNFTGFRSGRSPGVPTAEIQRRHVMPFNLVDFSKPWLTVYAKPHGRPVFHRSPRDHAGWGDEMWRRMAAKHSNPLFVGLEYERKSLESVIGREIEQAPAKDALEAAQVIAGSSILICNQSLPYAICDGLKHRCAVESTKPFLPNPNATHIRAEADWPSAAPSVIMLALQVYPGDKDAAIRLAELIVEIEKQPRSDVECAVFVRDDVPQEDADYLQRIFSQRFKTIIVRSERSGRGWPVGCNDLWQSCMMQISQRKQEGKIRADAVLTFEPDCLPMRKDWIDCLIAEWQRCKEEGKIAFGYIHDSGGSDGVHLNGNMVIDAMALRTYPKLAVSHGGWDWYHRHLFMEKGFDSKFIANRYGEQKELSKGDFEAIKKEGETPALVHGIKHPGCVHVMREMLLA